MVHPLVSDVVVIVYRVVDVSVPLSGFEVTFQVPATSASAIVAAAGAVSVAPAAVSAATSSRSLLTQATSAATQQLRARIRIEPSDE
jgi:hypothetical protein